LLPPQRLARLRSLPNTCFARIRRYYSSNLHPAAAVSGLLPYSLQRVDSQLEEFAQRHVSFVRESVETIDGFLLRLGIELHVSPRRIDATLSLRRFRSPWRFPAWKIMFFGNAVDHFFRDRRCCLRLRLEHRRCPRIEIGKRIDAQAHAAPATFVSLLSVSLLPPSSVNFASTKKFSAGNSGQCFAAQMAFMAFEAT